MFRSAKVLFHDQLAGLLSETDKGYKFEYLDEYLSNDTAYAISKTLPKTKKNYESKVLFPFFDGLVPEGWLLDIALDNWKINERDRFGLLLTCCKSTIGAVAIEQLEDEKL